MTDWVGTVGAGVCASGREYVEEGAIVALVAPLAEGTFRVFGGGSELDRKAAFPIGRDGIGCAVVHGDPRGSDIAGTIARLSDDSGAFLIGGLSSASGSALQIAGRPVEGGLSGVLLDATANRNRNEPDIRNNSVGFRVARTPSCRSRRVHGRGGRAEVRPGRVMMSRPRIVPRPGAASVLGLGRRTPLFLQGCRRPQCR